MKDDPALVESRKGLYGCISLASTSQLYGVLPGYMDALGTCPATPYTEKRQKHVKNTALGEKVVAFSSSIVLEQFDARSFKQDEEITLMNWSNASAQNLNR